MSILYQEIHTLEEVEARARTEGLVPYQPVPLIRPLTPEDIESFARTEADTRAAVESYLRSCVAVWPPGFAEAMRGLPPPKVDDLAWLDEEDDGTMKLTADGKLEPIK